MHSSFNSVHKRNDWQLQVKNTGTGTQNNMVSRKNQREKHFLLVTVDETGEVDQYLDLPDPEICNIFNSDSRCFTQYR